MVRARIALNLGASVMGGHPSIVVMRTSLAAGEGVEPDGVCHFNARSNRVT